MVLLISLHHWPQRFKRFKKCRPEMSQAMLNATRKSIQKIAKNCLLKDAADASHIRPFQHRNGCIKFPTLKNSWILTPSTTTASHLALVQASWEPSTSITFNMAIVEIIVFKWPYVPCKTPSPHRCHLWDMWTPPGRSSISIRAPQT